MSTPFFNFFAIEFFPPALYNEITDKRGGDSCAIDAETAAFFLLLSVVLLYAAFFRLFTRLLFGQPPERSLAPPDMSRREKIAAVVFGMIFLVLSVMPGIIFDLARQAVGG